MSVISRVLFLGTSAAVPVPGKRNCSAIVVATMKGAILVDCGEGTQHQIYVCGSVRTSQLQAVCI